MLEVLRHFKPVTSSDVQTFTNYYNGFTIHRKYPRFYMSTLWLGTKSEFIWGIVDGCLCVVKRRVMFKSAVIYLILPPVHPTGDLKAERAVLHKFYKAGIGARLSSEDVALYGLTRRVVEDVGNAEYIYKAGDYANLAGKQNKGFRRQWKELAECCQVEYYTKTMAHKMGVCARIDKGWKEGRTERSGTAAGGTTFTKQVVALFEGHAKGSHCMGYTVQQGGEAVIYAVTQQITAEWVILLTGRHTFTERVRDAALAQHLIEARYWYDAIGSSALLNMGASIGVAGLIATKQRLRPTAIMQIYKLHTGKKLTLADYYQSKHTPKETSFGLGV